VGVDAGENLFGRGLWIPVWPLAPAASGSLFTAGLLGLGQAVFQKRPFNGEEIFFQNRAKGSGRGSIAPSGAEEFQSFLLETLSELFLRKASPI
jgi:hypothetical protein